MYLPADISGRTYRYYLPTRDIKECHGASSVKMLAAGEIEEAVMAQMRGILRSPEMVTQLWRKIGKLKDTVVAGMTDLQVSVALNQIDTVWEQLYPLEKHRIVQLLVGRIIVAPNELQVKLRPNGVENLALDVIRDPGRSRAKPVVEAATTCGPTRSTSSGTRCCCAQPTAL
ncbi:MAG: hypothetical protein ABI434_15095 [Burkholderiaceae bacterium]